MVTKAVGPFHGETSERFESPSLQRGVRCELSGVPATEGGRATAARSPFIRRVRGGPRQRAGVGGSALGVAPTAEGDRGRDR